MDIPDYVAPIIGYRCWLWDGSRLLSLNGQPWDPGCPLVAHCNAKNRLPEHLRPFKEGHPGRTHQVPQIHCTCGVYARKAPLPAGDSRWVGGYGPSGEVYLWGTVVEHSHGWRAQYAYPKTLVVTSTCDPLLDGGRASLSTEEVQSRLEGLTKYRADIVSANGIPVWTARSGYNPAGIKRLRKITPCLLLNPHELELLPLLGQGMSNREIAMRLRLNEFTVRNYMLRIFDKLGVSTRLELVYLLMSSPAYQGLIKPQA